MNDPHLASPEWSSFTSAIRDNPDDDTPRLVAADWLQETEKPELEAFAEFIRLQIAAARSARTHVYSDSCDCGGCRSERRATILFDRWGHIWAGILIGKASMVKNFVRGFPVPEPAPEIAPENATARAITPGQS